MMDPDVQLQAIRDAVSHYELALEEGQAEDALWNANDVVALVQSLDEWLSRKGYLPVAWAR